MALMETEWKRQGQRWHQKKALNLDFAVTCLLVKNGKAEATCLPWTICEKEINICVLEFLCYISSAFIFYKFKSLLSIKSYLTSQGSSLARHTWCMPP